jgi:hypothetical protein
MYSLVPISIVLPVHVEFVPRPLRRKPLRIGTTAGQLGFEFREIVFEAGGRDDFKYPRKRVACVPEACATVRAACGSRVARIADHHVIDEQRRTPGSTGARAVRDLKRGVASLCIGGGEATAMAAEAV